MRKQAEREIETERGQVERARAGDIRAFDALIGRYRNLVYAVAYDRLRNFDDARDAAQETFIRAFLALSQLREPARFGPWLRQIAVNECLGRQRRGRWAEELTEVEPDERDAVGATDLRIVVEQALGRLDPAMRLTVTLFYLHAYSMQEIGDFLEEPVSTIKSRLRNARVRLRKELADMVEESLKVESLPRSFAEQVTAVIEAAAQGDARRLEELLRSDRRLAGAANEGKTTALHVAANAGNLAVVDLLLANGADPNARDVSDNASPLHYASERGLLDVVRHLVEAGADVNTNDDLHERGPLGWATVFGSVQTEVADYLIAQGARYDMFSAIALDRAAAVKELIATDPEAVNARMSAFESHRSAVVFAMSKARLVLAELLVAEDATVGVREAAALGRVERLRAEVVAFREVGILEEALRIAIDCAQIESVRALLEMGADANAVDDGRNTLFAAIGGGHRAIAELLIEHGADLEFRDDRWKSTPLGWQVFFGNVRTTQLGLDLGALVDPGWVALTEAGERGELRPWSFGTPESFRAVRVLLQGSAPS